MRASTTIAAGSIAVLVALGVGVGLGVGSGTASTVVPAALPAAPAAPAVPATPAVPAAPVAPAAVTSVPRSAPAVPAKPAPAATVPGIPCSLPASGEGACVSLSKQRAWLIRDGKVATSVPAATGKSGSTTPVGKFKVLYKDIDHWSKEFDAPMPNSVFFYPGDAFHSGSVSTRSNGCVHLSSSASKQFFSTLSVGDPVQVVK